MFGGRSKPSHYCKILTYVEHKSPALYECIQDLCLYNAFNPSKGDGITFLMPNAKATKELAKLVSSDTRKAADTMRAHIIPLYLETIESFNSQKEDIPTLLGIRVPIASVSDGKVTLKNGSTITAVDDFKRMYENSAINIFEVDGLSPTEGLPTARLGKKKMMKKVGGGRHRGHQGGDDVKEMKLPESVDNKEKMIKMIKAVAPIINSSGSCAFTRYHVSLFNSLHGTPAAKLMAKTYVGPLGVLHDLCMAPKAEVDKWASNLGNHAYNNADTLDALHNEGAQQAYYDSLIKCKSAKVGALKPVNIVNEVCAVFSEQADKLGLTQDELDLLGGREKFCQWWASKCEFAWLCTGRYIESSASQTGEIFELFHNFYCAPLCSGDYGKAMAVVRPNALSLISDVEVFCTMLAFMVSPFCAGAGGSKAMLSALKGYTKKEDVRPDSIVGLNQWDSVISWTTSKLK